jgi:long-chain acyl-CoA synthetase
MTSTWFADERLAVLARERPGEPAVIDGAATTTWSTLDSRGSSVASLVRGEGVAPGARVALIGGSVADRLAAILGVNRAGAVAAPVHGGMTTRELAAATRAVDPALVIEVASLEGRGRPDPAPVSGATGDPEAAAVVVLTSGTTGRP